MSVTMETTTGATMEATEPASTADLKSMLERLLAQGFDEAAIAFVCEGMKLASGEKPVHVPPADLVAAIQEIAYAHCADDAKTVLARVGLKSSADVGRLAIAIGDVGALNVRNETAADYEDLPWFETRRPTPPPRTAGRPAGRTR